MYVEVKDQYRNSVPVSFSLDSTVGDVRNALNCSLASGFAVAEFELVPGPFGHYVEDDPECFKGPGDNWFVADVFFDALAADLRRCEADFAIKALAVCLPLASLVPLGPPCRVGLLFPGERAVDAMALERLVAGPGGAHVARLFAAASAVRGRSLRAAHAAGGDAVAARDATLVLALANIEARMCGARNDWPTDSQPAWERTLLKSADIAAVCGFGAAGEAAALVFCGALTLKEGLELGDARAAALTATVPDGVAAAASVIGGDRATILAAVAAACELGPLVVSHELFDCTLIVGGAHLAVDAFAAAASGAAAVRQTTSGRGAHTPLAVPAAAACASFLVGCLAGGTLVYPLYCASGAPSRCDNLMAAAPKLGASLAQPVAWRVTVELMLQDNITHFVDAGGVTHLKTFMTHISPQAALLMAE